MSRWTDALETHPYRASWENLRKKVDTQEVHDPSVEELQGELDRLRKVFVYLDELIPTVDPELTPLSTWDNLKTHADNCHSQLTTYDANQNLAHLQKANVQADAMLTQLRPYMVLPKDAAASLKRAATIHLNTTEGELAEQIEKGKSLLQELEEDAASVREKHMEIVRLSEGLTETRESLLGDGESKGLQEQAESLLATIQARHDEVLELQRKVFVGDDEEESMKARLESAVEFARRTREELKAEAGDIVEEMSDLREFHTKAFGVQHDDDEAEPNGLEHELDSLLERLKKSEETQKKKHAALKEQIEGLLPGATSAGMASAYGKLKKSYLLPIVWSSALFISCIGTLVYFGHTLSPSKDGWEAVAQGTLQHLPLYGGLIWLGYYASKRRSEAQRLRQEYAHKEAVASSYMSYKQQIEELDEEQTELLVKLLEATIDTITRNASETLDGDHGDKSPAHRALEEVASLKEPLQKIATKLVDKTG